MKRTLEIVLDWLVLAAVGLIVTIVWIGCLVWAAMSRKARA